MNATTHHLEFNGAILRRGFWLYVWEFTLPDGSPLYYVGRTGDSSSINAQSPFNLIGQHLGSRKESNALRRHLLAKGIDPRECTFRWVAHGQSWQRQETRTNIASGVISLPPMKRLWQTVCARLAI